MPFLEILCTNPWHWPSDLYPIQHSKVSTHVHCERHSSAIQLALKFHPHAITMGRGKPTIALSYLQPWSSLAKSVEHPRRCQQIRAIQLLSAPPGMSLAVIRTRARSSEPQVCRAHLGVHQIACNDSEYLSNHQSAIPANAYS